MFNRETVLVVGAGGSFELGLPVGETLKSKVAAKLDGKEGGGWTGDNYVVQAMAAIAKKSGSYRESMRRLTLAAQAIKSAMPQAISIDNYLHTHADDPDIVVMGKVGIAVSILEAERASAIYGKEQGKYFIEFARSTNTWHNTFCKMLTESVQRTSLERLFETSPSSRLTTTAASSIM